MTISDWSTCVRSWPKWVKSGSSIGGVYPNYFFLFFSLFSSSLLFKWRYFRLFRFCLHFFIFIFFKFGQRLLWKNNWVGQPFGHHFLPTVNMQWADWRLLTVTFTINPKTVNNSAQHPTVFLAGNRHFQREKAPIHLQKLLLVYMLSPVISPKTF